MLKDSVNLDSMKSSRTSIKKLLEKKMPPNTDLLDGQSHLLVPKLLLIFYSVLSKPSKLESKLQNKEPSPLNSEPLLQN